VNRNVDETRPTDAVFLGVAEAFHTIWIEGLICKLTILNFASYLVKTISLYHLSQTLQMSFHLDTSIGHIMWAGVA
jgi:hypothetical protein